MFALVSELVFKSYGALSTMKMWSTFPDVGADFLGGISVNQLYRLDPDVIGNDRKHCLHDFGPPE